MIRLSKSCVGEGELAAVTRVVKSAFFGMGQEVFAFERELASFLNVPEVVCVNTGTSALHLALEAIGLGPGDEVLAPTLTYVATFQAISATGATAVPCDVEEGSLTLDIEDARRRITAKTKALVFVHYASCAGGLAGVHQLAKEHKLRVIEDAAHAFGCRYKGHLVGSFGDIVCFSFDGIKNITSGEGGAVVSRDQAVLTRVKEKRSLGLQQKQGDFEVTEQGWRYHMSDLFAAIGRAQLSRLSPELGPRRVALARRYQKELSPLSSLRLLPMPLDEIIPHIYPICVDKERREALKSALQEAGVAVGLHYKPNHLLRYYKTAYPLPVAEKAYQELVTLPLHPEITDEEQSTIVTSIKKVLG